MEIIFNELIDSFIANKVGIADNFLSKKLSTQLKANLVALYGNKMLNLAGTGGKSTLRHNDLVRSDVIYWLDRKHNDLHENDFFDLMDKFIRFLNESCYTGITNYEFHYTLYETGSFYTKHVDQFQGNDSRKYSMIMYLNEDWQIADGGQLCIYHPDQNKQELISPENGKTVFFKSSELQHEVLPTNKARMSITGWLKS
ncbi:MAG: 2OG-Fe(II) oxygenase [Sphingobacteriales bacterium]|nr:MAG: 2OG-Fe(II) oxygenase [Sphingobacteriales bacterium]